MDAIGDLLARDRWNDWPALHADRRVYSHHDLWATGHKAGNFFKYLGVAEGRCVEIDPEHEPEPLLSFFGAVRLGAVADFDPTGEGRVVVVPRGRETDFDLEPGHKLVVYGGQPRDASTYHWEEDVWSENPASPRADVGRDDVALVADGEEYTHGEILDAADELIDAHGMDEDTSVAVRSEIDHPGTLTAGIVAPLKAGGTVILDGTDELGDIGVGSGVSDPDEIDPDDVF